MAGLAAGFFITARGGERRRNTDQHGFRLPEPTLLSEQLPNQCIHTLLVPARPLDADVPNCSSSRPQVHLVKKKKLSSVVDFLPPPSFGQLDERLRKNP